MFVRFYEEEKMKFRGTAKDNKILISSNQEFLANTYVIRCFHVTMGIYLLVFLLNVAEIFIIDHSLMEKAFFSSAAIYLFMHIVLRFCSLSNWRTKYFILSCIILVFTITGVYLTYHVIFLPILPFLYATLYSSKRIMRFVYTLSVISTIFTVLIGYYVGLCDANMTLLTSTSLRHYNIDGVFSLSQINPSPISSLLLFYALPRCLIYIAFFAICNNIVEFLSRSRKKTEHLFIQTITALSEAVDAKDRYTSGHSKRVAEYSQKIAKRLGKSVEEQEEIYRAGLLHDVGKIRIPEEIINKASRLTDAEFNIIKIHPITGHHILSGISDENTIAIAAKYHHERYDGKGYPNGIKGEQIPEIARIIGVADSYDAMSSNRSYRNALPQDIIIEELKKEKGKQFDPKITDIMLQLIAEDKEYQMQENTPISNQILVADQDPAAADEIALIMKDQPFYEITAVTDGKAVLELLEKASFDLLLLDSSMPEIMDPQFQKKLNETYQIPIVLMTRETTLEASVISSGIEYEDYITKPLQPLLIKEVMYYITEKTMYKNSSALQNHIKNE